MKTLMPGSSPGMTALCSLSEQRRHAMARCEQCGNDYDKSFEVSMGGRTMIFDSFECAIQALAR